MTRSSCYLHRESKVGATIGSIVTLVKEFIARPIRASYKVRLPLPCDNVEEYPRLVDGD